MISWDLSNYQFSPWERLSKLKENNCKNVPNKPGVYVFRLNRTFGRLVGESDILYIGGANNLKTAINNYIQEKNQDKEENVDKAIQNQNKKKSVDRTIRRLRAYLLDLNYLDKVRVSWKITEEYENLRDELIDEYKKDHHELPPWNRQSRTITLE